MKKIILQLVLASFLIAGCSGGGDDKNSCGDLTTFGVSQQIDQLKFNISGETAPLYYEISYQNASGNPDPENGSKFVINSATESKPLASIIGNNNGNVPMVFYARAVCDQGNSEWIGPKSLVITDYCDKPESIYYSSFDGLHWSGHSQDSYWQVQYGAEGFTLGSGTTATSNDTYLEGIQMHANTSYDFYVRSNCSGQTGWSAWAGPYTYFSETNQNLCVTPSNTTYTVVSNGSGQPVGAEMHWDSNGETQFEYAMMSSTAMPTATNIHEVTYPSYPTYTGMTQNYDYRFYVRAICSNGNRTAWSGPTIVNIGN